MPDAADQVQLVALEPLARPAAVAEAPAGELGGDVLDRHGQARGQSLDDHAEGLAVRLAGGQVAQHGASGAPSGGGTREDQRARLRRVPAVPGDR